MLPNFLTHGKGNALSCQKGRPNAYTYLDYFIFWLRSLIFVPPSTLSKYHKLDMIIAETDAATQLTTPDA